MANPTQMLILGAGYGGMSAALRLAHQTKRLPVQITLVNAQDTFVERVRLHQLASAQPLRRRSIPRLLDRTGIHFVQGWITALEAHTQQIHVKTAAGEQTLGYDYLIYALGSIADKDSTAGVREHTLAVGDLKDAEQLRAQLAHLGGKNQVMVVGGGLTGIETATEIAERYRQVQVELITAGALGAGLSDRGRAYVRKVIARLGIAVRENTPVQRVVANAVVTATGEALPFDVCAWAGAFRAAPLAQHTGLPINGRGQLLVNAQLHSINDPRVYVVGDAAAFADERTISIRMACATAIPMSIHAADNLYARLTGGMEKPFGFGYVLQCVSLGRRHGLVQFVNADDSPQGRIITGRLGAWVKEAICQFARISATAGWAVRAYRWRGQFAGDKQSDSRAVVNA